MINRKNKLVQMKTPSKQIRFLSSNAVKKNFLVAGILAFLFYASVLHAQVMILSSSLNSFNITPQSLCSVTMMNYGNPAQVYLQAKLTNSAGEPLLVVRSAPFTIKKG